MATYIARNDSRVLKNEWMAEIMRREAHHDHKLIVDEHGYLCWEEQEVAIKFNTGTLDLSKVVSELYRRGKTKNSEEFRQLFRDLGYSLYGYWEIFYWEANNDLTDEYVGGKEP